MFMAVVTVLYSFYFPRVEVYLNFRKANTAVDGDVPVNPPSRHTKCSRDMLYGKTCSCV